MHVVTMMNMKAQDLADGDLGDKRIHELKVSLDFGSKLTILTILAALDQDVGDYGFTYGDTLEFALLQEGDEFFVRSTHNGKPLDFTSKSAGGELPLEAWSTFFIDRMYFGSIGDLDTENPDNHLIRATAGSETALEWWAAQLAYEARVFLKDSDDDTPLPLQTIDRAAGEADSEDSNTSSSSTGSGSGSGQQPSSTEIVIGETDTEDTATAISTETSFAPSESMGSDMALQFNTLDSVGTFERTQKDEVSIAHGVQISLGLDNVVVKDGIATNVYQDISLPTSASKTETVEFSNAEMFKLDGSDGTQTSPKGKALQLNHYVPIEIDRLRAQINQENAIALLGANEIPDNHVYSEKVRQNTLRGVQILQGEHYKVDLSTVDPENAAVTRTSSADDSIHVEGASKTREAPERSSLDAAGFIRINSDPNGGGHKEEDGAGAGGADGAEGEEGAAGAAGSGSVVVGVSQSSSPSRASSSSITSSSRPVIRVGAAPPPPSQDAISAALASSFIASQIEQEPVKVSRPGFLRIGGMRN